MARILIVDDEPRNRLLLDAIVGSEGHQSLHAASGADALALAGSESPDLVLLDLMMPAMDGFQVVRQLKANAGTRALPILVVSALDDPAVRQRAIASGADDFLRKPVDRWQLLARVRSLLGSPSTREAGSAHGIPDA